MGEYHGHGTLPDGTHVPLTKSEADALWQAAKAASAREAELMPDTAAVLRMTTGIRNRLHRLGWCEGIYCPKDGSDFAVIVPGCSAILTGCYIGEWPHGDFLVLDETVHPSGSWWKALDKLTTDEREKMDADMTFNIACAEGEMARCARIAGNDETET